MKNKALKKDFRVEVKKSASRFISILLIVVLGVAFYSGIRSSMPAMQNTADSTYDDQNLMDIRVLGTMGLTKSDVDAIKKVEGVKDVEGSFSKDFLCYANSTEIVTKAIAMPDKVNDIEIVDGRYPQKYNEAVVSREFLDATGFKIGDYVTLVSGTDEKIFDTLASETYTIVGVCSSALFLNGDLGTSAIGDGTVDGCVIIPREAFVTDVYTEIYVTVQGAAELGCFGEEYEEKIKAVTQNIKSISDKRCDIRFSELRSKSSEMLEKARKEYYDSEALVMTELADKSQKLLEAEQLLKEKRLEFENKKELYETSKAELPEKKEQLEAKKKEIADAEATIKINEQKLAEAKKKLQENKVKLDEAEKAYMSVENNPNATAEEKERARQAFLIVKTSYMAFEQQTLAGERELEDGKLKIKEGKAQIEKYEALLSNTQQFDDIDKQLAEAEKQLASAEKELQKGNEQYQIGKEDAEAELADAKAKLNKAEEDINNMSSPEWYVLDRSTVASYASYKNSAESIGAIGTVFPIIFFLVAALVSLTTMTRMVEEQRTQIGTLKALGYSKGAIARKYILYSLYASVLGSIIGVFVGELTLPAFIVVAYKTVYYNLGDPVVKLNALYGVTASVLAVLCTTLAAYFACYKELKSAPAQLMRPEAPKAGKRILLEKITPIWERLNFSQKATARNIFRYKKRFFMTLFGVGGCMALLLVGLGIRDSVSAMAHNQYGDVFKYDGVVTIDATMTRNERRTMLNSVNDISDVEEYLVAGRSMIYGYSQNDPAQLNEKTAYLVIPGNGETFANYVKLAERAGQKRQFALGNDGVIITEKYAKLLDVSVGDSIFIKQSESDSNPKEVKVTGITENYIYNYIYMTPSLYQSIYSEAPKANMIMVKTADGVNSEDLSARLLKVQGITSVSMYEDELEELDEIMSMLYLIIAIMIVAAGLLAFVVIYNLNNINIGERRRELAAIKLLGFTDKETAMYVYRENFVLTLIGTVLGIFMGILLHRFVMTTVETDMEMFGRELSPWSILIGAVLTILFAVLVNFAMYRKIKKIDMVESLKSVE